VLLLLQRIALRNMCTAATDLLLQSYASANYVLYALHTLRRHAVACFLTRGDLWQSWEAGAKVTVQSVTVMCVTASTRLSISTFVHAVWAVRHVPQL
jgi:FAD binding domain of DNA photolyase